jgi:hypothetical protein
MMLHIHYTRVPDLERPDHIVIAPAVPISGYRDGFGNWCFRILAPPGEMRISTDTVVNDTGLPDSIVSDAAQISVQDLPEEALVFLLASRLVVVCSIWRGHCSVKQILAGHACRQSAILCMSNGMRSTRATTSLVSAGS